MIFTTGNIRRWNFRLVLACFAAVSVGLPIAWISLAKVLVLVVGFVYVFVSPPGWNFFSRLNSWRTSVIILGALVTFCLSALWTQADWSVALLALTKHAKLLTVLMLPVLIRTEREARIAVIAFVAAQSFVLASSWLMAAGIPVPWVTNPIGDYVVFSSYLDQSIMLATSAAVIWHLRSEGLWPTWLAGTLSVAALADTLFLLDGRSGFAVAITMMTLAIVWAIPPRFRLLALLVIPVAAMSALYTGSSHIQNRVSMIISESKAYGSKVETDTSSGWRLNAWQRSIQAIQEQPLHGHGVGSWAVTVKRLEGVSGAKIFGVGNASNPHQEYLLWGVELGLLGTVLLIALLLSLVFDAKEFSPGVQKALWSVVAALAVACLFNSSLYDDLIGDYFCVALGLLLAMGMQQKPLEKAMTS